MTLARTPTPLPIEMSIARARLALSGAALVALLVDPTEPFLGRWSPMGEGRLALDPYTLAIFLVYLAYSALAYGLLAAQSVSAERIARATTWGDVLFGAAIAFFTEGSASPFDMFFVFAVLVVSFRAGLRRTLRVTAVSVLLYLSLIVVSAPGSLNFFIMRPVHLAIIGYLVGYVGEERRRLQERIEELAAGAQRSQIAADLHDGWAQALAGINLRLETVRQLLRRQRPADAEDKLRDLQASVAREYDAFRSYMRSLADAPESRASSPLPAAETRVSLDACFRVTGRTMQQVLQILQEGTRNVLRHAGAREAQLRVAMEGGRLLITIDDDGVGLPDAEIRPWSITQRVEELGGRLDTGAGSRPGAHLEISLPEA